MALIIQADLEKFSQIDFISEPDAAVSLWIDAASAAIETYCQRTFTLSAGIVETLDGSSRLALVVAQPPVSAVNSVTEDGTVLTAADFQWYPDGRFYRLSGDFRIRWPWKAQSVIIDYDGGYATVPDDVKLACARIVERIFHEGASFAAAPTGVKAVTMEDQRIEYDTAAAGTLGGSELIDGTVRLLLAPYVRRLLP